jgi:ribosomal protein S18 acetylase RimI-like enzyme
VLSVRDAQPADALAVAEVHVRSWQRGYRGLMPDDYLDGLRAEERAARYVFGRPRSDHPSTLVAVEDEAVRGFATIGTAGEGSGSETGELLALYVDPCHWGRGIGRRLILEARERLVERGFDEAILWVLAGNARAERFYRADGWIPDGGRRQQDVWGITADEIRYRRSLVPPAHERV